MGDTRPEKRKHRRKARRVRRMAWATFLLVACAMLAAMLAVAASELREPEPVGDVVPPTVARAPGAPEMPRTLAAATGSPGRDGESGFRAAALEEEMRGIFARRLGVYGAVVHDPLSGETADVGGEKTFFAASIGKLPAMLRLYKAADGGLSLEEKAEILPQDIRSYGSGVLHTYPPGTALPLRQHARYLMQESDNTAWAVLDRRLGEAEIQAQMDLLGATGTDYFSNTTTPEDVLLMLRAVADPSFTSPRLSREMLDHMTDTAYEDRMPAAVGPEVRVAHKIGTYGSTFSDAGLLSWKDAAGRERRLFVVVLSAETVESEARLAIREATAAAYREANRRR